MGLTKGHVLNQFKFGHLLHLDIRELKLHVYGERHADSSWEFPTIKNEQIKTTQNNSYGKKSCLKLLIYV